MKVINNNFIEIDCSVNIEQILEFLNSFLKSLNIDNNITNELLSNMDNIYIQITNNDEYTIKLPNGSYRKNKISNSVGALKTNMIINNNDTELNIVPGVVMRNNYNNHQLIHELLHGLSSLQHSYYDEYGITYTKTGTKIDYYDKSLNDHSMEINLSSEGLNEGITEYLTSILTNEYTGNYAPFVVISKLFMKSNNYLLNAYFMNDISGLKKFYDDLEERQSLITKNDFINLTSKCVDFDLISKIIMAGLEYNKSYGNEISEKELQNIIIYLDNNMTLDTGSWYDLIIDHKINKTY